MRRGRISFASWSFVPQDSIHEKNSAFSTSDELKYLRDEGHFLSTYPSGRHGRPAPNEASVEYLRDTARIRLCLDRASDFLSELQGGSGKPSAPSFTSSLRTFSSTPTETFYPLNNNSLFPHSTNSVSGNYYSTLCLYEFELSTL